ncbi:MAG: peroxidase family protein [bacterium]
MARFFERFLDKAKNAWDEKRWDKLPTLVAIPKLVEVRDALREHNLIDTGASPASPPPGPAPERPVRMADGSFTDVDDPAMGQAQTRFGRNFPLGASYPEEDTLLTPSPRAVSQRLLARQEFKPATTLNLLAAAWVQFQTHDWFAHPTGEVGKATIEVPLPEGDAWPGGRMAIERTPRDPGWTEEEGIPPTYLNRVTHWWDASQIYGSDLATERTVRSFVDGKLKLDERGLLPTENGKEISGFTDNWWVGLSLMHTLFTREHNVVCDRLKEEQPDWDDQRLFETARLIVAALIAKIHTVEWTPAILAHPTLEVAMNANWWGMAGEWVKRTMGRLGGNDVVGGIVGGEVEHHGAPYQITEEFVTVYRMHPLMPDDFEFIAISDGRTLLKRTLPEVAFNRAREVMEAVPLADLIYSFGVVHPGSLTLHNYPKHLQNIALPDGRTLDLATVDILRDRERGVPRYNQFRRLLRLPAPATFDEMTDDPLWARELEAVYGDVEKVDVMAGMFAETPPAGFGFSETAFRIFVLMASRRLKSDRFFTDDFRPEVYTELGIDWVNGNSMGTVLLRHCPELMPALVGQENAFKPWSRV